MCPAHHILCPPRCQLLTHLAPLRPPLGAVPLLPRASKVCLLTGCTILRRLPLQSIIRSGQTRGSLKTTLRPLLLLRWRPCPGTKGVLCMRLVHCSVGHSCFLIPLLFSDLSRCSTVAIARPADPRSCRSCCPPTRYDRPVVQLS